MHAILIGNIGVSKQVSYFIQFDYDKIWSLAYQESVLIKLVVKTLLIYQTFFVFNNNYTKINSGEVRSILNTCIKLFLITSHTHNLQHLCFPASVFNHNLHNISLGLRDLVLH